jgi:hypothetical protein
MIKIKADKAAANLHVFLLISLPPLVLILGINEMGRGRYKST